MARWTRAVGIFTFFLLVSASISDYIIFRQLNEMHLQLDEMKMQRRPWISSDVSLAGPLQFNPTTKTASILFDTKLKNSGQTPAIRAAGYGQIIGIKKLPNFSTPKPGFITLDFGITKRAMSICQNMDNWQQNYRPFSSTIFPGEEKTLLAGASADENAILEGVKISGDGNLWPYIVFCVNYTSLPDNKIHHTVRIFQLLRKHCFCGFNPKTPAIPKKDIMLVPFWYGIGLMDDAD